VSGRALSLPATRTALSLAGLGAVAALTWLSISLQHPVVTFPGMMAFPLRAWPLAAAAVFAGNALEGRRRALALAALGALAAPLLLGPPGWAVVAFALAACAVGRLEIPAPGRVALLGAAWAGLLVAGPWLPRWAAPTDRLRVAWAALAYAGLLVVLERARHLEKAHWTDELAYLLAPPRLLTPFFQPMLPAYVRSRVHAEGPVRGPLLGVGLALLAMALTPLQVWVANLPVQGEALPVRAVHLVLLTWLQYARGIFAAVALLRLMGFDLASGFRAPFLATSYADFFRRWNHYVRDTVAEAFFLPFFARLSARLPARVAAVLAGYGAILVGVLLLSELLVPLATGMRPEAVTAWVMHPVRLGVLLTFWSLVVLPEALGLRLRLPGGRPVPAGLRTALFLASLLGLAAVMLSAGTRP